MILADQIHQEYNGSYQNPDFEFALPEFQKIVREVLGDNFIQIYTDLKGNKESGGNVSVRIMYPANITEEVKVEVDSGSSQKEMGGRLGFRISPKKF